VKRREFLIRAGQAVFAAPMVLTAISCGKDAGAPTNPNVPTDFSSTSTTDNGHAHTMQFKCSDLASRELTYTSLAAGGHTHEITLTSPQLDQILANQSVGPIESTNDFGHTHFWTIQKPSSTCA